MLSTVTQSQTGRDKKTAETGSTETKWRRNQEPERHSKEAGGITEPSFLKQSPIRIPAWECWRMGTPAGE